MTDTQRGGLLTPPWFIKLATSRLYLRRKRFSLTASQCLHKTMASVEKKLASRVQWRTKEPCRISFPSLLKSPAAFSTHIFFPALNTIPDDFNTVIKRTFPFYAAERWIKYLLLLLLDQTIASASSPTCSTFHLLWQGIVLCIIFCINPNKTLKFWSFSLFSHWTIDVFCSSHISGPFNLLIFL